MRHHRSTTFRGWRVALLLVAGALLSPQRASAECGSHVTVLNPTAESRHDAMPPADGHGQPLTPPCQGPNCSGAPERPVPPVPPASTDGQIKELASGAGLLDRSDPPHFPFDRAAASARPIHRPFSIFHPPPAV
jgi:hypothetical protein